MVFFMKLKKSDIGRWATVKWDDVGRVDCLIVDINQSSKTLRIFEPFKGTSTVGFSQITELRKHQTAQ